MGKIYTQEHEGKGGEGLVDERRVAPAGGGEEGEGEGWEGGEGEGRARGAVAREVEGEGESRDEGEEEQEHPGKHGPWRMAQESMESPGLRTREKVHSQGGTPRGMEWRIKAPTHAQGRRVLVGGYGAGDVGLLALLRGAEGGTLFLDEVADLSGIRSAVMSRRFSWGSLVAGVVVGCAGATGAHAPGPTPASTTPAPASIPEPLGASASASSAAPEKPAPRVGSLVMALPEARPEGIPWWPIIKAKVRYGRGVFSFTGVAFSITQDGVFPACPLRAEGDSCGVMEITSTGKSPGDDGWRRQPEAPAGKSSGLKAADRLWESFSPGRDVVYAFSPETHRLDRIDDRGVVTAFLEDEPLKSATAAWVIEASGALLLLQVQAEIAASLAELEVVDGKVTRKKSTEPAMVSTSFFP
jgi:hypothetical protein